MFVSCWSVKGGVGTTVVAASLALVLAEWSPAGALLVDLAGDAPATLGVAEPSGAGVVQWLNAGAEVPADALTRLEVPVGAHLGLLPRGASAEASGEGSAPADRGSAIGDRAEVLAGLLALDPRSVVVDCGTLREPAAPGYEAAVALAAAATHSWLVTRACYLALRRAVAAPLRPSGFVLVSESGRSLRAADIEEVLGVPLVLDLAHDPSIARAVDAGLLAARLPRSLVRAVRSAA
jgi:hypothetical protein